MLLNVAVRQALRAQLVHSTRRGLSTKSHWANYEMAPLDPIIGLNEAFAKDDYPNKVIVGVGAYRDDAGKPYVLPCVREAEKRLMEQNLDMEYSGIVGHNNYIVSNCFLDHYVPVSHTFFQS